MSTSEKIKTINNKIEQNKAQYNLHRQIGEISALSSGSVSKYEFLTGKDVLPEKDLLEKAASIKRFEYSPLGKELKKQTSVAEKQYQEFESNKKEKKIKRRRTNSNIVYDNCFTFFKYCDTKEFSKRPPVSKLNELNGFKDKLELFYYDTEEIKLDKSTKSKTKTAS